MEFDDGMRQCSWTARSVGSSGYISGTAKTGEVSGGVPLRNFDQESNFHLSVFASPSCQTNYVEDGDECRTPECLYLSQQFHSSMNPEVSSTMSTSLEVRRRRESSASDPCHNHCSHCRLDSEQEATKCSEVKGVFLTLVTRISFTTQEHVPH